MDTRIVLLGLALASGIAQTAAAQTKIDLRMQGKAIDFSSAPSTKPMQAGSALPATCSIGELFFQTSGSPGFNVYACSPANSWSPVGAASFSQLAGTAGAGQLPSSVEYFQSGAGAPTGPCTAGQNTYLDATNLDYWFCNAANNWKKLMSTSNTGPFALTGQTGPPPATPGSGLATVYLNSTDKTLHTVSDAGTDMRYAGLGETNIWGPFLQDFSASTIKIPTGAGLTATTNGIIGYDSTGNQLHAAIGSADAVIPTRAVSVPTIGNCVKWGANGQLQDQGSTCAGATTASFTLTGDTTTITNGLVKLSGSTAMGVATTDTGGAIGICTASCGAAGTQSVTYAGIVGCSFDATNAPTAGDYVIISPTVGGKCRDTGVATFPSSGQVIGRAVATGSVSTTQNIDLFPAESRASSGGSTPTLSTTGAGYVFPFDPMASTSNGGTLSLNVVPFFQFVCCGGVNLSVKTISIPVFTGAASSNVAAALYADSNGAPGSLIAATPAVSSSTSNAAAYANFASPQALMNGTVYWLALSTDTATVTYATNSSINNTRIVQLNQPSHPRQGNCPAGVSWSGGVPTFAATACALSGSVGYQTPANIAFLP